MSKPHKFIKKRGTSLIPKLFKLPTDIIDMLVQMQKVKPGLSATDVVKAGIRSEFTKMMGDRMQ